MYACVYVNVYVNILRRYIYLIFSVELPWASASATDCAGSGQTRDVGDLSAKVLPLESRQAVTRTDMGFHHVPSMGVPQ